MSEVDAGPINTFVVAHNSVSRLGLTKLIEDNPPLRLGGTATTSREALSVLLKHCFNVVVIEESLDEMAGHDLTAALRSREVAVPILLIADHCSGDLALKVLGSGATGFITSSATPVEVVDAICHVAAGLPVLGSEVGAALVPELQRRAHASFRLTEREIDILNELAVGGTAKEIADRLHLAVPTIKNHVAHLYAKLGVRDRGAAVAEAMRQGWLQ